MVPLDYAVRDIRNRGDEISTTATAAGRVVRERTLRDVDIDVSVAGRDAAAGSGRVITGNRALQYEQASVFLADASALGTDRCVIADRRGEQRQRIGVAVNRTAAGSKLVDGSRIARDRAVEETEILAREDSLRPSRWRRRQ